MLLNVHSYFSLRYGTISIDDLIKTLVAKGHHTAVLTDINNSSAVFPFIQKCRESGLNGLVGMEYRNGDKLLYVGIARNEAGFGELNELMTTSNRTKKPLPDIAPAFRQVYVIYPYRTRNVKALRENEFIGIKPSELNQIVREPRANFERYVILWPVTVKNPKDFVLHQQLRAVDHNLIFSKLKPFMLAMPDEMIPTIDQLLDTYSNYKEIIKTTEKLLTSCSFSFDFTIVRNKKYFTGNAYDDKILLEKLAVAGMVRRYGPKNREAKARVEKELRIIDDLRFSAYFLITHDIIRYAVSQNFHHVGRGSGANSIVAYCLGITDVCPIELDLYFERFLNPKRKTPPDFDIDFSWKDRDEIYDYIFRRYQTSNTALMGAMSTFKDRSIIRELGKVYGLPKEEIDNLIKNPNSVYNSQEAVQLIKSLYGLVSDFPNQRTIHACGVLISEDPITNYTALDFPPKGLPTAQFDMYVAEDIKFEKFDILSQRGLGHIKDCVQLIEENRGEKVDITNPRKFFEDPKIKEQIRSANTIGCFYIESPAMRQLITKLECDNYLTLVAASSVIRPGVASSGMMKAFIERHRNPETTVYLHPVMKEQLQETYGVMVYQEDVIKVGHYFGGLDLADADVLRRMMSGKSRSAAHLKEIEGRYFENCKRFGYPEDTAKEVWRQMESFAGYSFSKAHSASFAVESFQSLYLKTYFPIEFMVSVLNNYGGFYDRRTYLNEAKKAGAIVHLPCVNKSFITTALYGIELYLGFDYILDLEQNTVVKLLSERAQNGAYADLKDFILRTGTSSTQMAILIRAGVFAFTGKVKTTMQWESMYICKELENVALPSQLFQTDIKIPKLPDFEYDLIEHLYDEIRLLGFPVSGSWFDLLRTDFRGQILARDMHKHVGETVRMVGEFVTYKPVRTKHREMMMFGNYFDINGDFFDTVHFPNSMIGYKFQGQGAYLIEGKVTMEYGCPSITVSRCAKIPVKPDPRILTEHIK
ncbi:helix-hairpin-helix domain-containing protein [Dyadobacter frigoris]|uniref:DNA polymerase III subunit alpha n=1 Tax=Dyadobacter frigoris TaxID=2576211 RepID=A0A4U6CN11_9BACT|nr:PHP domain-containing protein [Dyadobacter frigoris]TKT84721.1 DNA polymerase III subunit alpha [Dyadobacter frigoris]